MIISFGVRKGIIQDKVHFDDFKPKYQRFHDYKLPATMDTLKYGKFIKDIVC